MALYMYYVVLRCVSNVVGFGHVVVDTVRERYRTNSSRVALLRRLSWLLLCVALVCWVCQCTVGRAMAAPSRFEASVPPGHGNPAMPQRQYATNLPQARRLDASLPDGWHTGFCVTSERWFYIHNESRSTTWMHPARMQQYGNELPHRNPPGYDEAICIPLRYHEPIWLSLIHI